MKIESKHTPGPWHIENAAGGYEIWPKDEGQTHSSIARVYRKDDARLIAAAPELLTELKELLQWLEKWPHQYAKDMSGYIAACEAAIAKATAP